MSLIKYYDALFENEKINNEYVTYLSAIHMMNTISKRDNINNKILKDLGVNYSKKALIFYENAQTPLCFLNDDIQIIYDFTKDHINRILKNPHNTIVKEQQHIKKEKIKAIDAKTFKWLANKPGSSFREKLANVEKISSTVKRYSYNIKENQVLLAYFKDILKILNKKISVIGSNPDLFGQTIEEIDKLKKELNKKNYIFKTEFEEVVEKDYSTPNNALIGNVDYSSVWNSYIDLKQKSIDYSNAFSIYKKSFINMFVAYLMNYFDFIEDVYDSSNICNYILYNKDENKLQELLFEFDHDFIIKINQFNTSNVIDLVSSKEYVLRFEQLESDDNRGVPFNLYLNDELIGKFYSDILGFKEAIAEIKNALNLKLPTLKETNTYKNDYSFISINSFDNRMYSITKSNRLSVCDNGNIFNNNDICFANNKNLYFSSYKKDNYLRFLRQTAQFNENVNKTIIYDINDTFDEFSSATVRRAFSSIYPKSYPVWRSILAGESVHNKDSVKTILDFCGKSFSISQLERKKNRFIHCGPVEVPIYYQVFNEFDFYETYLNKYQKKYDISYPNNVINEFIESGALHSILNMTITNCIVCDGTLINHNYYIISFDDELFSSTLKEFEGAFSVIIDKYDKNSTISIVPDFLETLANKYNNIVCNKHLINGANEIVDRLKNNEITWYEKLPKLSLEIIKDGMFDNLILVDNQECENIIGKSFRIIVNDILTLSKGNKNYILPLNKSFIGEQNDFFVAKAEDPSFPLSEDIDVRLIIEYSFGTENSYLLKLIPLSKPSPFEEIIVKWEKEEFGVNNTNPKINDVIYNYETLESEFSFKLPKTLDLFAYHINSIKQNKTKYTDKYGRLVNVIQEACRDIQVLINKNQRISHFNEESKRRIRNLISSHNVYENVMYLLKRTRESLKNRSFEAENKYILNWRAGELEEALMELSFDSSLYSNKFLMFPETTYGRYFAENPNDGLVLDTAYSHLINITSNEKFFETGTFRLFLNKMTSATACRNKALYEMAETKPVFMIYMLRVIINSLKELSTFDWNKDPKKCTYYSTPKENGFLVRYCVELLISFLHCRDLTYFKELRPGGKLAKEIIFYLKNINRNIFKAMEAWSEEDKKKNMLRTKYHISLNKPKELFNMWNEAYCLILYLSGDERVNYIKIGTGD